MTQLRSDYEYYLQELEESSIQFLYDEDGHVVSVRQMKSINPPPNYITWLNTEIEDAIDREDYEYAAQIRDEIIYLKLYTTEEFERYLT